MMKLLSTIRTRYTSFLLVLLLCLAMVPIRPAAATAQSSQIAVVHQAWNQPATIRMFAGTGTYLYDIVVGDTASDNITSVAWSPDGTEIAYMKNGYIYIMNPDGTDDRQLSQVYVDPDIQWAPYMTPTPHVAWSPDGTKLAFTTLNSLYLMNRDGSNERRVINADGSISWIGIEIATTFYWGYRTSTETDQYIRGPLMDYWYHTIQPKEASWSPDGSTFIVPARTQENQRHEALYSVTVNGKNFRQVSFEPENYSDNHSLPSWSPDSRTIAYVGQGGMWPFRSSLYIQDMRTGNKILLDRDEEGAYSASSWRPSEIRPFVYRFWSDKNSHHFYTSNSQEALYIMSHYPQNIWSYEGMAYQAGDPATCTAGRRVHRFWSAKNSTHFYTNNEQEKQYVIDAYDDFVWNYEGVAFCGDKTQNASSTLKPVYRFWSPKLSGHFYTTDAAEKQHVIDAYDDYTWTYEGVAYYVW